MGLVDRRDIVEEPGTEARPEFFTGFSMSV